MSRAPYRWLWASMPLFLLIVLLSKQQTVDIQMHDTYLVASIVQLAIIAALFCGLLGLVYWVARRRRLIASLTISHLVLSVGSLFFFLLLLVRNAPFIRLNVGGLELGGYPWLLGSLAVLALSQLLLIANLGLSRNMDQQITDTLD